MTSDDRYLLLEPGMREGSVVEEPRLAAFTERHKIALDPGERFAVGDVLAEAVRRQAAGIVIGHAHGLPSPAEVELMAAALRRGLYCFSWWPDEQAVERVDDIRLVSFKAHRVGWVVAPWLVKCRGFLKAWGRHAVVVALVHQARRARSLLGRVLVRLRVPQMLSLLRLLWRMRRPLLRMAGGTPASIAFVGEEELRASVRSRLGELLGKASPLPLPDGDGVPSREHPLAGLGVYLRLDYWAPTGSGGSVGHTCYVAKHLAAGSEDFICLMAQRYDLLDALGVPQVVVEPRPAGSSEREIVLANDAYLDSLRTVFALRRPAYVYERICLGNHVGAALSQEFGIPYIVEYNGSEVSMARSFGAQRYEYEELYELAEKVAFAQATLITVVSEPIRDSLIQLGVDPEKILVNPNGAEPDDYKAPSKAARAALRDSLGFGDEDCVVGFTGTFGGWHGIDVLAAALPKICQADESIRVLLVGDGQYKRSVDAAIAEHGLSARCVCTGRVPQQRSAELLGACDVFVSPHSSHMVDSRFFGSPTKIFEYMSMGGGIVASDLEQIGQVLRPALVPGDFRDGVPEAGKARAVLCEPGDVEGFVRGVLGLAANPTLRRALGRNARKALLDSFSWQRHVERVWAFAHQPRPAVSEAPAAEPAEEDRDRIERAALVLPILETGDSYKDEVQRQWNVDACGSQYMDGLRPETREWYLEAERYRYEEYGPWMPRTMEFASHRGEKVLEVGGGMGTDLAQFAKHGALTTDVDLSAGHLVHAQRNFALRGLNGRFVHQDAETLPFDDDSFDVVYSNGVIHHTPNTQQVIDEMWRVLRPGGKVIAMVYAENSWHYWRSMFLGCGIRQGMLPECSMGEIMSRGVERSSEGQRPLVKVYTARRLRRMFSRFDEVSVVKRQLTQAELPGPLRWMNADRIGYLVGWNLVVKGKKPRCT